MHVSECVIRKERKTKHGGGGRKVKRTWGRRRKESKIEYNIIELEASPKKIVSSAYCNKLILISELAILKPLYRFAASAVLIRPFNASATILNKKGARGSPCLRPL